MDNHEGSGTRAPNMNRKGDRRVIRLRAGDVLQMSLIAGFGSAGTVPFQARNNSRAIAEGAGSSRDAVGSAK
jgi:hypothetical protein